MHTELRISRHALSRYRERVDLAATEHLARKDIQGILASGHVSPRPRWWMKSANATPGAKYLYSARRPGVCIIIIKDTVVTVLSRPVCARWRAETIERDSTRARRAAGIFQRRTARRRFRNFA